jgi:hypothetical protein
MEKHGFDLKTTGRRAVEEVPYGMYVWEIELDGETQVLGDGDGNVMNVFCMKGDKRAIRALADAARSYGKPLWWSGKRRINDEELQEQQMREKLGLNPDPMDYAALMDELKAQRHGG